MLTHSDHGDEVPLSRDGVDLGDALDAGELRTERGQCPSRAFHENDRGQHHADTFASEPVASP